jgi:hypothetical protein
VAVAYDSRPADNYTLFNRNGNDNCYLGAGFFIHKGIIAVKRAEFISDGMSHIILRSHWCDIIFLNVYAPTQDKSDDTKNNFMRN